MSAPLSPFYESGSTVYISGQVGSDLNTQLIPRDFEQQALNVFKHIEKILGEAGLTKEDVVKTTVYLTDLSFFEKMNALYVDFFGSHRPARTTVGVAGLPEFPEDPTIYIEIDAIAAK